MKCATSDSKGKRTAKLQIPETRFT